MRDDTPPGDAAPDDTPPENARGRILALVVIAALVAGGWWLMHRLGSAGALQDCIASGRHDCGS